MQHSPADIVQGARVATLPPPACHLHRHKILVAERASQQPKTLHPPQRNANRQQGLSDLEAASAQQSLCSSRQWQPVVAATRRGSHSSWQPLKAAVATAASTWAHSLYMHTHQVQPNCNQTEPTDPRCSHGCRKESHTASEAQLRADCLLHSPSGLRSPWRAGAPWHGLAVSVPAPHPPKGCTRDHRELGPQRALRRRSSASSPPRSS
jgi:hypothetical protein